MKSRSLRTFLALLGLAVILAVGVWGVRQMSSIAVHGKPKVATSASGTSGASTFIGISPLADPSVPSDGTSATVENLLTRASGSARIGQIVAGSADSRVLKLVIDKGESATPATTTPFLVLLSPDIHLSVGRASTDWNPSTDFIVTEPVQGFTDGRKFGGYVSDVGGVQAVVHDRGTQVVRGVPSPVGSWISYQVGRVHYTWYSMSLSLSDLEMVASRIPAASSNP